jgi:hypothetical protein
VITPFLTAERHQACNLIRVVLRRISNAIEALDGDDICREYKETDFGRRFGWWLCLRKQRIADLNYWRWDCDSQFWHEYRLFVFCPTSFGEIGVDPNRWCEPEVSLESRCVEGFYVEGILMAPRPANLNSIRSAYVPEDRFRSVASRARDLRRSADL